MAGLLAIMNATDEEFGSLTGSIENCNGAAQNMQKYYVGQFKRRHGYFKICC